MNPPIAQNRYTSQGNAVEPLSKNQPTADESPDRSESLAPSPPELGPEIPF